MVTVHLTLKTATRTVEKPKIRGADNIFSPRQPKKETGGGAPFSDRYTELTFEVKRGPGHHMEMWGTSLSETHFIFLHWGWWRGEPSQQQTIKRVSREGFIPVSRCIKFVVRKQLQSSTPGLPIAGADVAQPYFSSLTKTVLSLHA